MKNVTCLILYLFFSANLFAQVSRSKPTKELERPRELVSLLNSARLAGPEVAVDIFLKVSQFKGVQPAWRLEILEEALRLADDVKYPFSRQPIHFKGINLESAEIGTLGLAFRQKLDRLSLKSRLIKQFLLVNRERAKEIVFSMGGQIAIKKLSCDDAMGYDVTDIYSVVADVAKESFTQKEINYGYRAIFLTPWIENIESPAQIEGISILLAEMHGSPSERQLLLNAFARSINRNFGDDRSFTYALSRGLTSKISRIVSSSDSDDVLRAEVRLAYGGFFTKNLRGSRCLENEFKKGDALPSYVDQFNRLLAQKPLNFEDVVASEFTGKAKVGEYAQTNFTRGISKDFQTLRGIFERNGGSKSEKSDNEAQVLVNTIIENLLSPKLQTDESDTELFNIRCALFKYLLSSVSDVATQRSIITRFIRLLNNSPIQKENLLVWIFQVNELYRAFPDLFAEVAPEFTNSTFLILIDSRRLERKG